MGCAWNVPSVPTTFVALNGCRRCGALSVQAIPLCLSERTALLLSVPTDIGRRKYKYDTIEGMGAPKKADWREERRKRAWKLKEEGWQQKDIAVALGVSEGAVSHWIKRGREGGEEALKAHPPKGVSPRLTAEQKAQIPALLAKGAESVRVSRRCVDSESGGRSDQAKLWSPLSSRSRRQTDARGGLEPTKACGAGQPTQRRGHQEVVG